MASMGDDLSISVGGAPIGAPHAHGILLPPQEVVYRSRDELYQAVHTRAHHQGYSIIIQSSGPRNVNFGCKFSGKHRVGEQPRHPLHPRNRTSYKLGCPFALYAKRVRTPKQLREAAERGRAFDDEWELMIRDSSHNHPATNHHIGRTLNQDQIDQINELISQPPGGTLKLDPFWIIVPALPTEISPFRPPMKRPNYPCYAKKPKPGDLPSSVEGGALQQGSPTKTASSTQPITRPEHAENPNQSSLSYLAEDGLRQALSTENIPSRPPVTRSADGNRSTRATYRTPGACRKAQRDWFIISGRRMASKNPVADNRFNQVAHHTSGAYKTANQDGLSSSAQHQPLNPPSTTVAPSRPPIILPEDTEQRNHSASSLLVDDSLRQALPTALPFKPPFLPPGHSEHRNSSELSHVTENRVQDNLSMEVAPDRPSFAYPEHAEKRKHSDAPSWVEKMVSKRPRNQSAPVAGPLDILMRHVQIMSNDFWFESGFSQACTAAKY
ncbi:transposase [Penicillium brevicompactum]